MTDNIVTFPKDKIYREGIQGNEELEKVKVKSTINFADTIVEELAQNILAEFGGIGLEIDNEDFSKDFHFLVCILGATVYRTLKLEHPFHKFLSDNVSYKEISETELDTPQ